MEPSEEKEVVPVTIEMDLVPAWSNVVEKIGWAFGESVTLSPTAGGVVVEVEVRTSRRDAFEQELRIYWQRFREWQDGRGAR